MEDFKSLVKIILPQGQPHLQSAPSIPLAGHEPVYPPGVDGRTLSSAWQASPGLASDGADGEKALIVRRKTCTIELNPVKKWVIEVFAFLASLGHLVIISG